MPTDRRTMMRAALLASAVLVGPFAVVAGCGGAGSSSSTSGGEQSARDAGDRRDAGVVGFDAGVSRPDA